MNQRRAVYFAFQGLLSAVLLLMFVYQYDQPQDWAWRFTALCLLVGAPLVFIQYAAAETLGRWWFQTAFFLADAGAATLALYWRETLPEAYLLYFLIIFGTALTRSFRQSVFIGAVTCALYLLVTWHPFVRFETVFWLRLLLLIITTFLLSFFSRDAQKAQSDQEARYQRRLVEAERLATLGRVAGEVAHRIKGPLTTIKVNAELLQHKFASTPDARAQLREIEEEVDHCKAILKNLLDLGRIEEMDFGEVDLREPARAAAESVATQAKKARLELALSGFEAPLPVRGDAILLQEAVAALLQNAVEAGRKGGRLKLSVQKLPARRLARLTVEDDGRGIAEADLDRVFQPFFTTKEAGSGLGLSAALRIAQKHNGHLEADSDGPGKGARFTLTLPLA